MSLFLWIHHNCCISGNKIPINYYSVTDVILKSFQLPTSLPIPIPSPLATFPWVRQTSVFILVVVVVSLVCQSIWKWGLESCTQTHTHKINIAGDTHVSICVFFIYEIIWNRTDLRFVGLELHLLDLLCQRRSKMNLGN